MKNRILIFTFCISLVACNQSEVDELKQKNEELKANFEKREKAENELLASFNQIQENLSEIKQREGLIRMSSGEEDMSSSIEESINEDIELISDLMKENEELMNSLQQKLKNANVENVEFRKLISGLQNQLEERNKKIEGLNNELQEKKIKIGQLYYSVDSLSYANKLKEKELEETTDQLYEAYYAYGTFKELKEKNILSKEGGLLGIGKTESLNDDFNKEYFSKIDMRRQTSFLIYADEAELVTTHPENSYEFMGEDGKVDSLVIRDVEAFWAASKFMVVVVD